MNRIYFDHSATTPVDEKVLKAMWPYFNKKFGNASSIHSFGQEAMSAIDKARAQVADFLHCRPEEIIFTSGATEANNLAIRGLIKVLQTNPPRLLATPPERGFVKKEIHIITSLVEHDAVLEPLMDLEKSGVQVSHLNVDARGIVDLKQLEEIISDKTVLVSIMHVNSEVGAIMPIRDIGKIIKKHNEKRLKNWQNARPNERGDKPQSIYFHTDATQAVNFCNCDVEWNYVDMLSLSGHKIYGPKGVGLLYKRSNVPLAAIARGGHQENNLRSGTYNVPGIAGLGAAIAQIGKTGEKGDLSPAQKKENKKIARLRDLLVSEVQKNIPNTILNTDRDNAVPAHAHFSFLGVEGESILIALDLEGIAVSTGSACASGSLKASHVLIAMGIRKEVAHNSIRFTLGKHNTEAEIKIMVKKMIPIIERLRKMNPLYHA